MKPVVLSLVLTLATLSPAFAEAAPVTPIGAIGDEQAVERFIDEFAIAISANDAAGVNRLTAPGYTFVTPAGALQTAEQRLAPLRSGDLKYESVKYDEVRVRLYGSVAVATTRVTVRGHLKGADIGGLFRSTLMLVKEEGRWRLVASQASTIAQP